jgi:hypothetical protein
MGQGDAFVTINVEAGGSGTAQVLFSNGESTATLTIDYAPIKGELSGIFSVSETSKVRFSQGNLQYVGTWQFAKNQWDYFGDTQSDDHRDLFGWGTGDAPNKVSTIISDYATFTDWGINPIANGGKEANAWRTLTKDEWLYLFYKRTNAATLFSLGSVNGVNGTILLPDNWALPTGASFTASTSQGLQWTWINEAGSYLYYNSRHNNFSHNTYTEAQWEVMEAAGAIFLPAAGTRIGTDRDNKYDDLGYFWSATPYETGAAYYLVFSSQTLNPKNHYDWSCGHSVRLVR